MLPLVTVPERVDVLVLTAAERSAAVDHGEDHGGQAGGSNARQQVVVDEDPGQDGGVGQGGVDLGEVEEEPEEHERGSQDKYTKDKVESQEPLTPLSQQVALFWRPLAVGHLVTDVAQRLQLWSFAPVEAHRGGERADPVHEAPGQVQPQQLEGDRVEEDDDHDRDKDVLPEEDGEERYGGDSVEDGEGIERETDDHPEEGHPPLLALVEVEDRLEEWDEGDQQTDQLYEAPVPLDGELHLLELLPQLGVRSGEVADPLGQAVNDNPVTQHHQVQHHLAGGRYEPLQAPEVHGFSLAGRVAAAQGHHDHREQRVDHQVDPVRRISATAALVETALVDLGEDGDQHGWDD